MNITGRRSSMNRSSSATKRSNTTVMPMPSCVPLKASAPTVERPLSRRPAVTTTGTCGADLPASSITSHPACTSVSKGSTSISTALRRRPGLLVLSLRAASLAVPQYPRVQSRTRTSTRSRLVCTKTSCPDRLIKAEDSNPGGSSAGVFSCAFSRYACELGAPVWPVSWKGHPSCCFRPLGLVCTECA